MINDTCTWLAQHHPPLTLPPHSSHSPTPHHSPPPPTPQCSNTAFALVPSLDAMRTSISQATLSNMKSLQTIALIIALVQIVVIVPAFVVGVVMHALPLIGHRRALFQVLLAIPRHLVTR